MGFQSMWCNYNIMFQFDCNCYWNKFNSYCCNCTLFTFNLSAMKKTLIFFIFIYIMSMYTHLFFLTVSYIVWLITTKNIFTKNEQTHPKGIYRFCIIKDIKIPLTLEECVFWNNIMRMFLGLYCCFNIVTTRNVFHLMKYLL